MLHICLAWGGDSVTEVTRRDGFSSSSCAADVWLLKDFWKRNIVFDRLSSVADKRLIISCHDNIIIIIIIIINIIIIDFVACSDFKSVNDGDETD